jgi:hypothetical protein
VAESKEDAKPDNAMLEGGVGAHSSTTNTVEVRPNMTSLDDDTPLIAYKNDLDYCQDQILWAKCVARINKIAQSLETEDDEGNDNNGRMREYDPITGREVTKEQRLQKNETMLRKSQQKEKILRGKIAQRLDLTRSKGGWFPRLERLSTSLNLSHFEKLSVIHLISGIVSPPPSDDRYGGYRPPRQKVQVSDLLHNFCSNLEEQMNFRKYFYKNAILVKEGIFNIMGLDFMSDLTNCDIEIDRRMLDFVVGLDTEFSEIVDGSHLYTPSVEFDDVVLSQETKKLVYETVSNFDKLKQGMSVL